MTNKRLFLAGIAAGVVGGLLASRAVRRPKSMPHLEISRDVLAETRVEVQGAETAAYVQARYDELISSRPQLGQRALRRHLERSILPGLALYQILLSENDDREAAMAEVDRHLAAWVEHSPQRAQVRLLERLPDPYAALRAANRLVLKTNYPAEGWTIEWREDSDRCVAFDIRTCFYRKMLTDYGAPELTAHFCQGDDQLYGQLRGISWQRTKTLGRGDDRCDFRFCRAEATVTSTALAPDVRAVYACPACKGRLEPAGNELRCRACQVAYPLVDDIPDFLCEERDREAALGPGKRALLKTVVRLYETPLWYVPILKLAGGPDAPSYGEVIRQMGDLMDVREGVLLDVACGPGTWGRRLASPAMEVYGIDISWSMLRQGVRMAEDRRVDGIHFAHARVEALPFHDSQFDAAYCGGALHGFPDTVGALREIGHALKPGAPLVVLTFLNRDQPFARMRRRAEARNDKLVKLHMFEVPELEHALCEAGFDDFEPHEYGGVVIFRARKMG